MTVFSLVATHADLDLETVGTLSSGAAHIAGSVAMPAVTLSTCNRLEIYLESASATPEGVSASRDAVIHAVAEASGLDTALVSASFKTLVEDEAVHHLFEVGAGLDSAVIGEREIAGQVRRSLAEAQAAGTASGTLTKLFETATRAAKDVGASTALGSRGRSIVSVALDIAGQMNGLGEEFYPQANVLLVGTGSYAGTTLVQLAERGVPEIGVFSGSGRAEEFLAERAPQIAARGSAVKALAMDQVAAAFRSADLIIGCSGSNRQLTAAEVRQLADLDNRSTPLLLVDLALSHDVAPDVADLPGVELITLESVKLAAPQETGDSVEQARQLVRSHVDGYLSDQKKRSADDAIVALRRHIQQMLDAEMAKVRGHHGCTGASEEVEFATRRIVRKLLHTPTVRARELAAEGRSEDYVAALETLFGIDVTAQGAEPREQVSKRRRADEFSAAELAQMAAYLQQVPEGAFCRHHRAGQFGVDRLPEVQQLRRA